MNNESERNTADQHIHDTTMAVLLLGDAIQNEKTDVSLDDVAEHIDTLFRYRLYFHGDARDDIDRLIKDAHVWLCKRTTNDCADYNYAWIG